MRTLLSHFAEAYEAAQANVLAQSDFDYWKGYLQAAEEAGWITGDQRTKYLSVLEIGTVKRIEIVPDALDSATLSLLQDAGVL